uniref:AMP phosphorylase n=1 Tax=uncultured Candidatus Pacearchaeota archaeon TaxID=2109283 RepID=A0A447IU17_9ARCH|nr:AMP phosphorylase [uncultured Candidatus Pacearchaeota archaeon]
MELRVKFSQWTAGIPVVMLNKETANRLGVHVQGKVSIKTLNTHSRELVSIVDIIEGSSVRKDEILVSSEIIESLKLTKNQKIDVNFAPSSESLEYIKKKLNGKRLSQKEIDEIIKEVVENSLSDPEAALFISAMYKHGMTSQEEVWLIKSMLNHGKTMPVKGKYVVDKHSVGGVPGNRTTPIVVSICASAGLTFPKTSSRAITSAAGTADVMEAVCRVEFPKRELLRILKKTNAFLVWGGSLDIVPADSRLINIEKILKIDPESQLLASIMAKKFAMGSKYILIDIPFGKEAKVSRKNAIKLKRKFEYIGKKFRKKVRCVLTDGNQPIGNGIGPMLELMDVVKILDPQQIGPKDLETKSLFIAGEIFEMVGKCKKGKGVEMAKKILYSGEAFEKFKQIIKEQDGSLKRLRFAKFSKNVYAKKNGKITQINNKDLVSIARTLGCPMDKPAGIYLHFHVMDIVKKGEKVVTLYSETRTRMEEAEELYKKVIPINIR